MAPLDDDDDRVLDHLINGGFLSADEIKSTFLDEFLDGAVTEADRAEIGAEVDRRVAAAEELQRKWTGATTYDRLERAFARLNRSDQVVAMHNAGFTREAAMELVAAECKERGGSRAGILGGVYYTEQDLETALDTRVLRLGYFAIGPDAAACDAGIAKMMPKVLSRLIAEDLPAAWNGDQTSKIDITPLDWTKRLPTIEATPTPRPNLLSRLFGSTTPTPS
ncbi:DUF6891 domain-containing protein [Microlunatus speluncae]|uniref:DUF6891 domain-containing protein n=1 Tax=Microlunatus speluncae TaxID=2594267 RepID=UPI0012661DC1|nr:hypothetical protein [Microlunatus speluncae]